MFQNSLMAGAAGQGGFYDYQIDQSLRFNDDDSAYLSRTPASAGNRKTWTWSGWVKRGNLGAVTLFSADNSAGNFSSNQLAISAGGNLFLDDNRNVTIPYSVTTSALLRDPSAWYHIVVILDTSNATTSDRVRFYINGSRITNFSSASYPALNLDGWINGTVAHYVGRNLTPATGARNHFDGYMAEVNFVDGLALDPTSFGEFKSGVWVPKEYTGSYGTNGFYLSFADSAAIGDDLSGNGNDWTPSGLASTDVLLDSPTQNWCVLNPLYFRLLKPTLSEGNLKISTSSSNDAYFAGTIGTGVSGKYYYELNYVSAGNGILVGANSNLYSGSANAGTYRSNTGEIYNLDGSTATTGATYTTNDVIGVAIDIDGGTVEFYKNNVSQGSFSFTSGTELFVYGRTNGTGSEVAVFNFGQDSSFAGNKTAQGNTDDNGVGDFYYAPPAGFLALNTANLPEPTISPALDDVPSDYFNTVLYTGNLTTGHAITGVGFQPDWVWIKNRTDPRDHVLTDAVRGATIRLESNTTDAEVTQTEDLQSFDADGFTVGAQSRVNESGDSFVAWNWLAGNGTSSNTDGSITSTVSVNQKAGFSIVSYTGNGTSGATVGHGLGAVPAMVIVKQRNAVRDWFVRHEGLSASNNVQLNTTNAQFNASTGVAGGGLADLSSASTFGFLTGTGGSGSFLDNVCGGGGTYIAYCFAEVEGYSKFGSYTGNGSADGPFVYCGFRPAFVMVKRTDSTGSWIMFDNSRDTYNVADAYLLADSSQAEATVSTLQSDFLSNGFKQRQTGAASNASGGTYIYMAFAEIPVKYSGTMAR